jgi:hypothetical protein
VKVSTEAARGRSIGRQGDDSHLDLMRKILALRPGDRPTADEVLGSEWMVKSVLPDLDRRQQKKRPRVC